MGLNIFKRAIASSAIAAFFVSVILSDPSAAQGLGGATTPEKPAAAPTEDTPIEAPDETDKTEVPDEAPAPKIDKSRLPPLATYQAMLDVNKKTGWVSFRNYNGNQLIYFTALQTMHCRLKEIRYSINSTDLDQRFDLVKCNPYLPFSLPSNAAPKDILINLPLGEAETIAVQVVWEDDRESEVVVFGPCPDVGEATCATVVE